MNDELRSALAESAQRPTVSIAPVADILRAGRSHRRRRRLGMAAAAVCVAAAATAVPLALPGQTTAQPSGVGPASSPYTSTVKPTTTVIGKGTVGGKTWWVLAQYYPVATHACGSVAPLPHTPSAADTAVPGDGTAVNSTGLGSVTTSSSGKTTGKSDPLHAPVNTVKPSADNAPYYAIVIGASDNGKTITQQYECMANQVGQPVAWDGGADYPLDGTTPAGSRVMNGQPVAPVTSATITLSNGSTMTQQAVLLPGADVRTYAFVVPGNLRERSVNEYDAQHHLVDHQDL